jgi:hypothetical protein
MLGHLFFQNGFLSLEVEPGLCDRSSDVVAGVCSSSSSLSLLSPLARSGVTSDVRLERCERADRVERVDFWEAGRELGVRVEAHGPSGVSMAVGVRDHNV